ncbi:MAG: efflux RND transporter periplasmic adaptor subunit, partial [Pseudomonadota bacterium]|nr:efflux RND transporter periplasmic adaptor subunit [Pseudomonadota bacterium]
MRISVNSATALWLSLCLCACSGEPEAGGADAAAMQAPPQVEVVTLRPRDVMLDLEYSGRATGSQEVEVRARVGGILLRRHYQEGAAVEEGALLFEIDPQPFQVELARTRANVQVAQAQFDAAKRDWDRAQAVFERGAISESDRDRMRSAFELAEAQLAVARAGQEAASINLGYTKVTAPISGITSREAVSEGSLVGPAEGQSLLTRIVKTDPLYVLFSIPESEYAGLRNLAPATGDPLGAELISTEGAVMGIPGTVDFTASTIDTSTGTVQARATFSNQDTSVLPGQFVRVKLTDLSVDDALLVPQAAVLQSPQGTFVYTVDAQNTVQYT